MKTGCEAEPRFVSGSDIKAQKSVRVKLEYFHTASPGKH
jgi:hypothetical protein